MQKSIIAFLFIITVLFLFSCGSDPGKDREDTAGTETEYDTIGDTTETKEPKLCDVHSFESIRQNPDCERDGFSKNVCAVCGYEEITETFPALGHDITVIQGTRGGCYEDGWSDEIYCIRCKQTVVAKRNLGPRGHAFVHEGYIDPTCTESGMSGTWRCSDCGEIVETSHKTPPTGHKYGDWETVRNPTCAREGEKQRVCEYCGMIVTKPIPKTEHLPMKMSVKHPTCNEPGHTGGTQCGRCGEIIEAPEIQEPLKHIFSEEKVQTPPTCMTEGVKVSVCKECGKELFATIPPVSHVFEGGKCCWCGLPYENPDTPDDTTEDTTEEETTALTETDMPEPPVSEKNNGAFS